MPTDKKTIRSYDAYAPKWAKMARSKEDVFHKFLEKPAMHKKIPSLKGKSVLCVGCGTGEECKHLKSLGARRVVGIDISRGEIAFAKKSYPNLEFYVMDMEEIKFPADSFDFVFSHLTMHYVKDWTKTLKSIYKVLRKNGIFLLSTHHPVKWGVETKRSNEKDSFLMGYIKYKTGKYDVFGDYLNTRKVEDVWFDGEFKVTYYHRPLSEIIKDILKSGFEIKDFIEPRPVRSAAKKFKSFYEIHKRIPLFMIFELKKN